MGSQQRQQATDAVRLTAIRRHVLRPRAVENLPEVLVAEAFDQVFATLDRFQHRRVGALNRSSGVSDSTAPSASR